MNRFGIGYDIHRLVRGRPFFLAGVEIPAERGPLGHSDGDPLSHAVADAIFGAVASGDVGVHFPDNDPRFRGMPGPEIVRRALEIAAELGFFPAQADTVVVCQKPVLSPYRSGITAGLAASLGLDAGRVGLKFKTAEGLGPVGRCLAVSAWALVNMEKK